MIGLGTEDPEKQNYIKAFYIKNYIYTGDTEPLKEAAGRIDPDEWDEWHYAVMLEFSRSFFDRDEDVGQVIAKELLRRFYYLNLNTGQALLLFGDSECDYKLVVSQIRQILRRRYAARFYFAISRKFDGWQCLPEVFSELEMLMEERFYHPERQFFAAEEEGILSENSEYQDSMLIERISEDISRKDTVNLWRHFSFLKDKYTANSRSSAMYVKFVFSSVLQELLSEKQFASEYDVTGPIARMFMTEDLGEVISVTEESISAYEKFIVESISRLREEALKVKQYILMNCQEDLNPEMLASRVNMSPGYLSFIFKNETGMSISRFMMVCRMEKAKELMGAGEKDTAQASMSAGFQSEKYFRRSYREYFGSEPEEAAPDNLKKTEKN